MVRKLIPIICLLAVVAALAGCRSESQPEQLSSPRVEWLTLPSWAGGAIIYRVPGTWINAPPEKTQNWNWSAYLVNLGVDALWLGPTASAREVNRFSANLKRSGVRVLATVTPDVSAAVLDSLDVDGLFLRHADTGLVALASHWQREAPEQRVLFADSLPHLDVPLALHGVLDRRFYRQLLRVRQSQIRTSRVVETVLAPPDSLVPPGRALLSLQPPGALRPLRRFGAPALQGYLRFWAVLPGFLSLQAGQEFGIDSLRAGEFFSGQFTQSGDSVLFREYRRLIQLRNSPPALRQGQSALVQTSMVDGAASSFLRYDDTGTVLVIANLRKEPARLVLLTLSADQEQVCAGHPFRSFLDSSDTRFTDKLFFREIAPFSCLIYLGERTSSKGEL